MTAIRVSLGEWLAAVVDKNRSSRYRLTANVSIRSEGSRQGVMERSRVSLPGACANSKAKRDVIHDDVTYEGNAKYEYGIEPR